MTSARALVVAICLAFVVWAADWAYRHFELVRESFRGPPSAEALQDPWLGAERFLNRMGIPTKSVSGRDWLDRLPPTSAALVVDGFGDGLDDQEFNRLMTWVDAGGQLVFTARSFFNTRTGKSGDLMLDKLGIALRHRTFKVRPSSISEQTPEQRRKSSLDPTPVHFTGGGSANVGFNKFRYLQDKRPRDHFIVMGKSGAHVIQIRHGKGQITVLSDMGFMGNPPGGIEAFDNAWFLYRLLEHASTVWLIYDDHYDSLLQIMWRSAPELCIGLLALLAMWMWWLMDPFGPKRALGLDSRRNILEQLLAAANFEWRVDNATRRVHLNRELVLDELYRKHPVTRAMSQYEICDFLAPATGLDETQVELALFSSWRGEREFIELTAHLQQLHEAL